MKNYCDGGEAILEAFRNLGIEYIISSPGSEWGALWEALVRQKINKTTGPTYMDVWHETIAVDMAIGYTQITGKPLAVVLHAGLGLMQGSVGIHAALQAEIPMIVLSGESLSYGEEPDVRSRPAMVSQPQRGRRPAAAGRTDREMGEPGFESSHALRKSWCAASRWHSAPRAARSISTFRSRTCWPNGRRRRRCARSRRRRRSSRWRRTSSG